MTLHLRALLLATCLLGVLLQAGLTFARSVEAQAAYQPEPTLSRPIEHLGVGAGGVTPLLTLERLAVRDSLIDRLQFQVVAPFGRLRALVLRGQDHWLIVSAAAETPASTASVTPPSRAGPPTWLALHRQAE